MGKDSSGRASRELATSSHRRTVPADRAPRLGQPDKATGLERVTKVRVTGHYSLELTFDDGLHKEIDLSADLKGRGGVFEPLHDPAYFAKVKFDRVAGTVVWPNGADLAPEFLYDHELKNFYDHEPTKRKATS